MNEQQQHQKIKVGKIDTRRAETDRAFAKLVNEERRARLEKTMRLRSIRLVENSVDRK